MLLEMIKDEPMVDSYRKAPCVGEPYVEAENESNRFHVNNPAINQLVSGYSEGPENSYAKELRKQFAIFNE